MFRIIMICGFFCCVCVNACGDLPDLCIEDNEGPNLSKVHETYSKDPRIYLLPKTESNMESVYKECWVDGHFRTLSVCEIEAELKARIKDRNRVHINHYIDVMWKSMRLFKDHKDQEFANCFFNKFFGDVYLTILSLENELKKNPNAFNRNDLIYVVKSISDMQDEFLGYDGEPGSFFNLYKQLHLTGEYWQSEEGQNMINAVTGALSEGFSLK